MNETIARALAARLNLVQQQVVLTTIRGLVKTIDTDAFSDGKKRETMPAPYTLDSKIPDDWKALLPDPEKNLIIYFEDGGYSARRINGFSQVRSRLTLVAWWNGTRMNGVSRESMTAFLLSQIMGTGSNIPSSEPGLASIQFSGYSTAPDPFVKYSAYQNLFNFRIAPYGWLALDMSLTAYASLACLSESTNNFHQIQSQ